MFAVADWMKMKNSEETRKAKYEKAVNPPPIRESLARLKENKQIQEEISLWKKRTVIVGKDIPPSGTVEDYIEYPYIVEVIDSFEIIEIEERACALSKVKAKVEWTINNCKRIHYCITFGCVPNFV